METSETEQLLKSPYNDDYGASNSGVKYNECKGSVDDILSKAGGFGRYQILLEILVIISIPTFGHQLIEMYYLADDPSWQCVQLNGSNSSVFCRNHPGIIKSDNDLFSQRCSLDPGEWKFVLPNPSTYSIITEFKLFCSNSYMASLAHSAFFIGCAVTSLFVGYASDVYSRKTVLCFSTIVLVVSACSASVVTTMWQFVLVRVLIGAFSTACSSCFYVLNVELVLPKYRALISNIFQILYPIGILYLTLIAYIHHEWRKIALYSALPGIVTLACFGVYRSPRWLHSKNRVQEAEVVLKKLSEFNKNPIDKVILSSPASTEDVNKPSKTYTFVDFFRYKKVAIFVLSVFVVEYFIGFIYYTMYLELAQIGGSIYSMLALLVTADFPGMVVASYFPNKYGRKKTAVATALLMGACNLPSIFTPESYKHAVVVRIVAAVAVKFFYICTMDVLILWCMEIYPTPVRTQGFVLLQLGNSVGSATAPFIVTFLRGVHYTAPFIAVLTLSCLAALIFFLVLPETLGKPTRERFEDFFAENEVVNIREEE